MYFTRKPLLEWQKETIKPALSRGSEAIQTSHTLRSLTKKVGADAAHFVY